MNNKDRKLIQELADAKSVTIKDVQIKVDSAGEVARMATIQCLSNALVENAQAIRMTAEALNRPTIGTAIHVSEGENVSICGNQVIGES